MKLLAVPLAAALLISGMSLPAAALAKQSSKLDVQLIADQDCAASSGIVSYHILYHNVSNKKMDKAWLKVKISDKTEIGDVSGAEWDAAAGYLKWQVKDIDADGAGVVHFNLKVKAGVANGDVIRLDCEGDDDDDAAAITPPVTVTIGTQLHQPAFNGYPDGGFHPHGLLTRAETAAILSRLEQLPSAITTSTYTDVPADHWAYRYIQKVTQAGWMTGAGGRFRPDEPITRAEFAVLLLRVRGIHAVPLESFADSQKNWAKNDIGTGRALGIFDGDEWGRFEADRSIYRDEASKLLCIALYRGQLTDGDTRVVKHWPDVTRNYWSFGWVEELSLVAHVSRPSGPLQEQLVRYAPENTLPL